MKDSPSLQDIANAVGVSKMTVSLALRKNPRISEATRNKVSKAAERLGYRPNPEVGRFMSAIRQRRSGDRGMPMAYLTSGGEKGAWRESDTERHYWEGATERAREYGYHMEEHWLGQSGMTASRMSDIIWNRGISGVIVHPFFQTLSGTNPQISLKFKWKRFVAVAISDMLQDPLLNRVIHDHYTSILTVMKELTGRGYRRIGLCLTEHMDLTVNQRWQAGYRVFRANHPIERIEPLIAPDLNAAALAECVETNELDAVVGADTRMQRFFEEAGLKMGKDLAYADLDIDLQDCIYDGISGIHQNSMVMGAAAVDLLVAQLQRNETGVPKVPLVMQVEGEWHHRGSTPRQKKARKGVSSQ